MVAWSSFTNPRLLTTAPTSEDTVLRRTTIVWLACVLVCATLAAEEPAVRFSDRTTIRFAAAERGRELISRKDDFVAALSRFDLQSRLKTNKEVTADDLLTLYRENVTEWPDEDVRAVTAAIEAVSKRLASVHVPLPETVWMVRTTGQEESNAAYCRGPAIVLPARQLRQDAPGLERLVAHEMFHVLSTHNPALKRDLYAIIGFTLCEPIAPPKALAARTIANPDAPRIDCTIDLELADGERVTAAPILIASSERFDPEAGKSMFAYLQFRLLVVERRGEAFLPAQHEGQPRLIDPKTVDSFWKQIGRNTMYIIHPDEVLAENFALLANEAENLASPGIVAKLRERLGAMP